MTDATSGAGRVFGIDLGTTYSAIAYIDETGRPTVCRNDNNAEITPSVVHFETPDNVVVGETAKQSAFIDADNVVKLIKRRMGDEIELEFHGKAYTPESISALILKRLAADAAAHTQGPVEQAVITVPAYFGVQQKEATQKAGLIAGLDVVGVLPEPVAAAVHYDLTSGGASKTVLVYDLGGGTFDTTVIDVGGSEITVVCTDGDTNLGGADWDARLSDHVLARFAEQTNLGEPPDDDEFLQDVAIKVEVLKKHLSQQESRSVQLRFASDAAKVEVTRTEFEEMTADLLDRTVEIVRRTLDTLESKAPGTRIDEVLLVGGSTKMPVVATRLAAEFGWTPKLHEPDLAVAKGAALWGLSRVVFREQQEAIDRADSPEEAEREAAKVIEQAARKYGLPAGTVSELTEKRTRGVLSKAFGVKLRDDDTGRDIVNHLVFANEQLPIVDRHLPAHTLHHLQTQVRIEIFEQAGEVADEQLSANKPLSHEPAVIAGIPPQPEGQTADIDIYLSVDDDGLLRVRAREPITGQELTIEVQISLSAAQVGEAIDAVSAISVSS